MNKSKKNGKSDCVDLNSDQEIDDLPSKPSLASLNKKRATRSSKCPPKLKDYDTASSNDSANGKRICKLHELEASNQAV